MSSRAQRRAWNAAGVPPIKRHDWRVELDTDLPEGRRWVALRYDRWEAYWGFTQFATLPEAHTYATRCAAAERARAALEATERLDPEVDK